MSTLPKAEEARPDHPRAQAPEPPDEAVPPPAPFVCGVTRSGTTLIRLMLDSHPDLAIPGETHWVPKMIRSSSRTGSDPEELAEFVIESKRWQEFHLDAGRAPRALLAAMKRGNAAEAIRAFYKLYAEREGKTRYGDKTPGLHQGDGADPALAARGDGSSTSSATAATCRCPTCG